MQGLKQNGECGFQKVLHDIEVRDINITRIKTDKHVQIKKT